MTITQLSHVAMEMGVILLSNGAETYRVEESMHRICIALGAKEAETFVVPTTIILSVTIDNEKPLTRTRRIHTRKIDLAKVTEINQLSRHICYAPTNYKDLVAEIKRIDTVPSYPYLYHVLAFAFISQMFTLFFGGNFLDSCIGFIIGLGIKMQMDIMRRFDANIFFTNIIGGLIASTVAVIATDLGLTTNMDTIIIGSIMTLVPGLAITNSIRDIIAGDHLSGLIKGVEALLIGAAIAAGVAVPLSLLRPFWGG
ncbi:threonine/serine exporter family protein [Acetobacterium woodii]|uniref:Putative membrane protein n=1 Tax=Acetobacterium woodii (strain ATCC 29683 / DSM 1030 / JCM 2381 / KCTC 1655 / WB1) TaxID=931626 RepID=H6LF69_ACEWD|nr:threonine/serine exporter family protein [Acetobacterium woodii]AFA48169.1 putative membrane protein [Acetobacterium woodii DSM 1030]